MLHVTCAIIVHHGKVLICQRSEQMKLPLKWELPGGKVEDEEAKEVCLAREIQEELDLKIEVGEALSPVTHTYPEFSICLYPFLCTLISGSLTLAEHAQAIWEEKGRLLDYDWAAADIPVIREYLNM